MGFRLKTILGIAFIEALLLLALVVISLAYLRESNQDELQHRAELAATLFATATNDAVLSTDVARLEQLAADFLKNPGVVYVRVSDSERLLVQAGDAVLLQRPFAADTYLDGVRDGVYDTFATITAAGQAYGRVELGLSIVSIQAMIEEARRRTIGLAALEMALVALFSWLLGSYLTRQLRDLEAASNRVAQGDFSLQLRVRGHDELAHAAKAFNSMSAQMGRIYGELQQALAESTRQGERLQTVVDSQLDGLIAIDKTGVITLFSQSAERIFGFVGDEVLGHNMNMLMSGADSFWDGLQNRGVVREVSGRRKDGTVFPMDLAVTWLRSSEQPGFLCLVRDSTERKHLYEQLRVSEGIKKAMLEASLDAIITIDVNGCICEFNQSASAIFGYTLDEVLGSPMAELIVPMALREAHWQGLARYLKTGVGSVFGRRIEISALRRSGEEFPIELAITPIQHAGKTYFTAFLRDISEHKRAEAALRLGREQAEHASLVKSQFLAMMSHEIRTPLNAILGTQELLADTELDATQHYYLQLAKDAGVSLLSLLNDILDLTKVEAGKLELENSIFDAAVIVNDVLQLVEANANEKKLLLINLTEPHVESWILGDPWRLRQVLLNLVTNAIKFTPVGMITIRLSQCDSELTDTALLFEVIDTGIGIAEEVQPGLFGLFTQADPSDTRKYGGSGLGLAISKRLVELCGGQMGLESRLGVGSRFWFSYGRAAEVPMPAPGLEQELDKAVGLPSRPAKLLLVEDSLTNQAVLLAMLRSVGHDVDVADSGTEAIALVKSNQYDLIFMDVSMPDMDGMEATRHIRQLGGNALQIPIIAMTAHAVKGYKELCMAAGMNAYATKPINKKALLALVEQWRDGIDANASTNQEASRVKAVFLDDAVLQEMAEDAGMEDISLLLRIFITELAMRRDSIITAIGQHDFSVLSREAHTLKSGAATFGAWALHALALEMDSSSKQGDLTAVLQLAEGILPCLEETLAALEARCALG